MRGRMNDMNDTPVTEETTEEKQEPKATHMLFYAIYVTSGMEETVRRNLEARLKAFAMRDRVGRIIIPKQKVIEIKKGKRQEVERNLLQGYIILEAALDKELMHVIKSTPKVKRFAGTFDNPIPLEPQEVDALLDEKKKKEKQQVEEVGIIKGEEVKIISGPFADFTGFADEVNAEKATVKVYVKIFGRATPVDLRFDQVIRLSELNK